MSSTKQKEGAMSFDFQVNFSASMKRKPKFLINTFPKECIPSLCTRMWTRYRSCHEHITSHNRYAGKLLECAQRRSSPDPPSRGRQTHLALQDVYKLCPLILQTLKNNYYVLFHLYCSVLCYINYIISYVLYQYYISGCFTTKQHDSFHETFPLSAPKICSAGQRFPLLPTLCPPLAFNPFRWNRWGNLPYECVCWSCSTALWRIGD